MSTKDIISGMIIRKHNKRKVVAITIYSDKGSQIVSDVRTNEYSFGVHYVLLGTLNPKSTLLRNYEGVLLRMMYSNTKVGISSEYLIPLSMSLANTVNSMGKV